MEQISIRIYTFIPYRTSRFDSSRTRRLRFQRQVARYYQSEEQSRPTNELVQDKHPNRDCYGYSLDRIVR